jgi:GT2 family glycosyltransferase
VTPCLNPGARLVACLDSVSTQSYPNVEHLVIDGGSSDGTVELLEARRVRFISEPDDGQSDALNKGFALARGDIVGWLNADDVYLPEALKHVVAAFAASQASGWVYGDCEMRRDSAIEWIWHPPAHLTAKLIEHDNYLPQPSTFMARWALELVGPVDPTFNLTMDYDLWLRLTLAGVQSTYVPYALAAFEFHDDSKTGTSDAWEFYREQALALVKARREAPAAAAFGRSAAAAARGDGALAPPNRLRAEIERATRDACEHGLASGRVGIKAAAYAHAGLAELEAPRPRIRHLTRPYAWRTGAARSLILRRAPRVVWRRIQRQTSSSGC